MLRLLTNRIHFTVAALMLVAAAVLACGRERASRETSEASSSMAAPGPLLDQGALVNGPAAGAIRRNERAAIGAAAGAPGNSVGGLVGERVSSSSEMEPPQSPSPTQPAALPAQEVVPGSMLVRVGQAAVQVDSLEIGIARVRDMARRTGSVIANTTMQDGHNQVRAASLELRIPSPRFDEAVSGLAPIGKLESVNVSVEDVGEEFVDVQARVANARRLEQRLVELLANRTGKLSDVLTVERELARVRQEIERYEGRLRYLRSRASVSTLTIGLHEPYPLVAERPGARPIRDAFVQAWRNLVGVTATLIASLGVVLPLGALIAIVVFIGRRVLPKTMLRLPARPDQSEHA